MTDTEKEKCNRFLYELIGPQYEKWPDGSIKKFIDVDYCAVCMDLIEYLKHDLWRCDYYGECHCGLNDLTDRIGLERVPYEGKYPKNENLQKNPIIEEKAK